MLNLAKYKQELFHKSSHEKQKTGSLLIIAHNGITRFV